MYWERVCGKRNIIRNVHFRLYRPTRSIRVFDVPRGSGPGTILFILYTVVVVAAIAEPHRLGTHPNSDDTRPYAHFKSASCRDWSARMAPFIEEIERGGWRQIVSNWYPDKTLLVTPIIKKPQLDKTDGNNYTPISNLSVVSKLIERAVCLQLVAYLDAANLMPQN